MKSHQDPLDAINKRRANFHPSPPSPEPPRANSGMIDTFFSTGTVPIAKMLSIMPLSALGGLEGMGGERGNSMNEKTEKTKMIPQVSTICQIGN